MTQPSDKRRPRFNLNYILQQRKGLRGHLPLWGITAVLLMPLLFAVLLIDRAHYDSFIEDQRALLNENLGSIRAELEGSVSSNLQSVRGLVAVLATEPDMNQERFAEIARVILEGRRQLRNVGAARDMVISLIYPLERNRQAIGVDFRSLPSQWGDVARAAESGEMILSGPVQLVQGGEAFIGRLPVFITKEDGSRVIWGMVSAVIDVADFYQDANLANHSDLDLALRHVDEAGKPGDTFFGEQSLFEKNAVILPVTIPGGRWELTGRPRGGWPRSANNALVLRVLLGAASFAVIFAVVFLVWSVQRQLSMQTRLRALFEMSPIGIALNDRERGNFVEANSAFAAATGYDREELNRLSYQALSPPDYYERDQAQLQLLDRTGSFGPYEKEFLRKDGSRFPVLLNGIMLRDSSGRNLIWSIIEDITERKRVEQMKDSFIATVSHELRTPLTSISGALGLIASGTIGQVPDKVVEITQIALKNSKHLNDLINDLLDMEKLATGNATFSSQPIALREFLELSIEKTQTFGLEYGVTLCLVQCKSSCVVNADPRRLEQVMANLLSNAIKFSHVGGEVEVSVISHSSAWRIVVKDYGEGIPLEFQPYVFSKFSQADASNSRRTGGSGLGLAICRELVEGMGGSISFFSAPGKGAEFYVDLPVAGTEAGRLRYA